MKWSYYVVQRYGTRNGLKHWVDVCEARDEREARRILSFKRCHSWVKSWRAIRRTEEELKGDE